MANDNNINLINPISKADNLLDSSVKVTGEFGEPRGTRLHEGIDYGIVNGTNVYAAASGTIIKAVTGHEQFGNYVVIKHENGESTLYAHLSDISSISYLQEVSQGQKIGESGNTGYIIRNGERVNVGYHLHFEVIDQEGTNGIEASGNSQNTGISGKLYRIDPSKADSNSTPDPASAKASLTTTLATITVTAQKEAAAKSWFETFSDSLGSWVGSVTNFMKEAASDVVNFFSSPSESLNKIGNWISSAFTFGESDKVPDQSTINNSLLNLTINTSENSNNATSDPNTFVNGTVKSGGDYSIDMPSDVLNEDGLNNVGFDVDNDNYKEENTGWVKGSEAILLEDKNHNGKIDNITETISEYYTTKVADGLEALKTLDSNNDNRFDSNDAKWNDLRVWQSIVLFFLFFASISKNSYANYDSDTSGYSYKTGCKYSISLYTGCAGSVGYIHITPWQESEKKYKNLTCKLNIFIKRGKKNSDISKHMRGLPKVGSVVEPNSPLIFYQDLEQIKRQYKICDKSITEIDKRVDYKKVGFKSADESRLCGISGCLARINKYDANGEEDVLGAGSRLEIISYENLEEGLFAKIKVIQ